MAGGGIMTTANTNEKAEAKNPILKNGPKIEIVAGQSSVDEAMAAAAAQSLKAEKNSKPTLTRWKPQHRKAGDEFCQAALLYCEAGDRTLGKEMLLKACECYKKKRIWFSAAKAIDQAITLAHEQGEMKSVAELAWRSAALYRKAGHPDSAAQVLERAGKIVEEQLPNSSLEMLEKAVETVETENRPIQAACYTHKLLKLSLSQNSMDAALERSRKLVRLYQEAGHRNGTAKAVLGLVAILLRIGEFEEAENVASEYGNYCNRDQATVIEDLINGFDDKKGEMIASALRSPCMQALEQDYETIIRELGKMASTFSRQGSVSEEPATEPLALSEPPRRAPICELLEMIDEDLDSDEEEQEDANLLRVPEAVEKGFEPEVDHATQNPTVTISEPQPEPEKKQQPQQGRQRPRPLKKRFTVDVINFSSSSSSTSPRLEIGGMAESVQNYRLSSLQSPAPFMDVTGIDPVNPAQMGMTTDQWREWKRSQSAYEDLEYSDDYCA